MLIVLLAFLGLCLGSFVNALTWRLHEHKDWIKARSQCPHCGHELAAKDLIPIVSWLTLGGHCRYCKKPISWQYPAVELILAVVFVASYVFWPGDLRQGGEEALLVAWLVSSVGLMALAVYDIRWMLLPNKIIYPTLLVAVVGNLVYLTGSPDKLDFAVGWLAAVLVASGIFLLLFLISKGHWIGYGDVRLGLITGTLLHSAERSLLMIFLASTLGTLVVLPGLLSGKKSLGAKLPYGPFLIAATFISLIWGGHLIDWYKHLILP